MKRLNPFLGILPNRVLNCFRSMYRKGAISKNTGVCDSVKCGAEMKNWLEIGNSSF